MKRTVVEPENGNYSGWLSTGEVAAALGGISERSVNRMVTMGKLAVGYKIVAGRRPMPVYPPDQVEKLKSEAVLPKPASQETAIPTPQTALRLFLSIPEASDYSGLSQAFLRRACREGLPHVMDRGYRIPRAVLDAIGGHLTRRMEAGNWKLLTA